MRDGGQSATEHSNHNDGSRHHDYATTTKNGDWRTGDDLDHDEQTQISSATDSHSDKTRGGGRIGGSSGLLSREEKSDLKTQPASVSSVSFFERQIRPNLRSWHLRTQHNKIPFQCTLPTRLGRSFHERPTC
ncbi:uncharacterized protein DS421_12g362890 [Arachis hypogaea]|nr:uncharacterized protein DS421_12g362890 [Arachis hypogaea]